MHLFLSSVSAQELQKYEQFIFADYTSVIQVENVYEEILYQTLLEETLKGEDTLEVTVIAFWPLAGGGPGSLWARSQLCQRPGITVLLFGFSSLKMCGEP